MKPVFEFANDLLATGKTTIDSLTLDLVSSALVIATVGDPMKAPKEDLVRFREQLLLLKSNVYVIDQLGQQLIEAYRKFLASHPA